jgi:hypothetical protein
LALDFLEPVDGGRSVFTRDHIGDIRQQGFDLFASSGHDTKVRRQRARIIQEAVKVTSR